MRIDHSSCTHPRTPAGRRACRNDAAQRDLGIDTSGASDSNANRGVIINRPGSNDVPVAKRARNPRPTLDGWHALVARPIARDTHAIDHCVQRDLHRGGGTCACGWRG